MDTYKLVPIGGQFRKTSSFDIQVYTLGSDSWNITRQSEVPYYIPFNGMYTYGLLFNGALHWLGYTTDRETSYGVIVSFDISTERFGDVPLPAAEHTLAFSSNSERCEKSVAVLGDYLFLCNVKYDYSSVADIWVMQNMEYKDLGLSNFRLAISIQELYTFPAFINI
ncbi:F-box/kelch-repeat protein At3g06240-like [Papaver somniferum]|uniref:F-box/kelch-repeat protein At3g06240-like n=1 Tax=Papaver somniferum TaxID=3469 RepID=UPI000E703356|nr:F-box/kelch-repeat protein At3g06240-like [Papaver somniferum]